MSTYEKQLEAAPDPMSLTAFRKLVHVSPYTARYYIYSGLVPFYRTGLSHRFINISKSDVRSYFSSALQA